MKPRFHYGWLIVFAGMLCIFSCLGLARFAFGMLLPSMSSALKLTYSEMGFLSTGNFFGYLISVIASGYVSARLGARRTIVYALLLIGSSMLFIASSSSFAASLVAYTITGIGSGAVNVPMVGLISTWVAKKKRGIAHGFVVIGSGFAIMLSGRVVPYMNNAVGDEGWRASWILLSVTTLFLSLVVLAILRNSPKDKGLIPLGYEPDSSSEQVGIKDLKVSIYLKPVIYHLGVIYFLFGFTYVVYVTFIVTSLVRERGFSESVAGEFWAWIGFLSLFSGPVFGRISDWLGRKWGLIIVFMLQTFSYLLAASGLPGIYLYLSVALFGIVAWSIPSIMGAAAGDYFGAAQATAAFGFVTFIFGLGQVSGPAVAGALAEMTGSFSSGFYLTAACTALAIVLASFLKRPQDLER
ncbi:MAG: MFS transporter [Nitrospirae bacterium]|nr:MFS transporter [Nitrospirota bacterium]